MKLTYTIKNLSIRDAANLEDHLREAGLAFEARPAVEESQETTETKTARRRLSQAEVAEIYTRVHHDRRMGCALSWEQYGDVFGISDTTVARIAAGEHPLVTDAVRMRFLESMPVSEPVAAGAVAEPSAGSGGLIVAELA
jgi:hypothetical protein